MTAKEKELIEKVGESAFQNEKVYSGCTQAVLGAFKLVLGDSVVSDDVFYGRVRVSAEGVA